MKHESGVFGEAQEEKCESVSLVELRQTVGTSVFHLSPAELGEAVAAFKECKSAGMTLTDAFGTPFGMQSRRPGPSRSLRQSNLPCVKRKKERGHHMLRTSERDGNDSSVGCLPKGARRSTRLHKWTSGGFSTRAISRRLPSEINSATFPCCSPGRCQSTIWPRIHAGELELKAPGKGNRQRSCAFRNCGSFSLLPRTASGSNPRKRKGRPGGRSLARFQFSFRRWTWCPLSQLAASPACVLRNRHAWNGR